ncbi:PREDICTED: sushi, von Willebrand factor type A, EGF and pentraxin domain-containing protein 1-like isoform X2 [Amphimedon queenslandica]|uniref:Sushi domain-containing protein n=1 Tax=Amphimedon queenslandica TaxID=400682 RepID=A0A1X7VUM7_AMPQE|nr:PREDICTED: sushi, von Willebrand factor type A, EGF and pentraxin domain-containing protein 1-like isoform X2 [Amphimedon queenslandica]|eukprot:XP_019850306.1 PREDICTED: sushi, von Willebrand factor type A, EGF and pentraxin domain-containing protein 1-like isoform X2 [Amphimedon queenslandica]
MRALSVLLIIATVILVAAATRSGSGYRSDGYKSGEYRSGGYRSDGYRSGGYRSGGYRSGGYRSGGYRSGGYRSGGHRSGGYRTGGYRTGGYGYGYGGYKKVSCVKLSNPANGNVQQTGTVLGSRATYSCNKGFVLVGIEKRVCSRNGKWSGEAPICKRINCGPLPNIANGQVRIHPDTRLGSTATYSCNKGFNLNGHRVRRCLASGKWSGSEPSCSPVSCGSLPHPENGWVHISPNTLFGAVAIYRCKLGFELSSKDRRRCQANGHWSGSAPTCNEISCGEPPAPNENSQIASSEGTSLGDRTTYTCSTGFFAVGTTTIYCQNDGTYSDDAPICKPVDCGAPDPPDPNGSVEVSSTTFGGRALYKCNPGFTIVGKGVSFCLANGEWSNDAPECKPVNCGEIPSPKNGRVTFYPGTTFQSTATFTCRRGFRLSGSRVRTCQANGSWSGRQPTCIRIKCPKVSPPRYGKVYASGNYPGSYLRYDCIYGYSLSGPSKRVCLPSGHWDGKEPKCVKDEYEYGHPQKYHYDDNDGY